MDGPGVGKAPAPGRMEDGMNQCERISKYMDDFGSITTMQAFMDLGVTKLSNRISEMIARGERIKKSQASGLNRYGDKVYFTRYEKA